MGKTLLEHAAYELTKARMPQSKDPAARKIANDVMALVKRFQKQDHDDKTGRWVLEFFETLCNFMPITPITDDPAEWDKFEFKRKNIETGEEETHIRWSSKRASSIFSEDQGKTWFDARNEKTGKSMDHLELARKIAEDEAKEAEAEKSEADKEAAKNVLANAPTDTKPAEAVAAAAASATEVDQPAAEQAPAAEKPAEESN